MDAITNLSYAQFITISQAGRKVITPLHSENYLPVISRSQAMLGTKEQVDSNHLAESSNEVDFNIQSDFKPFEMVSLPLSGKIYVTSGFGERYHPVLQKETLHAGIDLRADYEMVHTIANGIIVKEGYEARAGNYIEIEHGNGIESIYCHLSKFLCEPGDLVFAGDDIAISGATGAASAPHLHFAIKENGKFIQPLPLLRAITRFNKMRM